MKGDPEVLRALNGALTLQVTSINQLFVHARIMKSWGLDGLNDSEYGHSIRAMKDADRLIERVLFLEGLPNLQDIEKLLIGQNVAEILNGDLSLQVQVRTQVVEAIALCESRQDYVSRDLLEEILEQAEEHIDWLESQLWLIDNAGLENYLQSGI